jgi:hypothetical protein
MQYQKYNYLKRLIKSLPLLQLEQSTKIGWTKEYIHDCNCISEKQYHSLNFVLENYFLQIHITYFNNGMDLYI